MVCREYVKLPEGASTGSATARLDEQSDEKINSDAICSWLIADTRPGPYARFQFSQYSKSLPKEFSYSYIQIGKRKNFERRDLNPKGLCVGDKLFTTRHHRAKGEGKVYI